MTTTDESVDGGGLPLPEHAATVAGLVAIGDLDALVAELRNAILPGIVGLDRGRPERARKALERLDALANALEPFAHLAKTAETVRAARALADLAELATEEDSPMAYALLLRFCEDCTDPKARCHDAGHIVLDANERLVAWEPVEGFERLAPDPATREILESFRACIEILDREAGGPGFVEYLCRSFSGTTLYVAKVDHVAPEAAYDRSATS